MFWLVYLLKITFLFNGIDIYGGWFEKRLVSWHCLFYKLKYKKGFGVYAFICISYYTYKNASLQIYKNESGNQNDRFL